MEVVSYGTVGNTEWGDEGLEITLPGGTEEYWGPVEGWQRSWTKPVLCKVYTDQHSKSSVARVELCRFRCTINKVSKVAPDQTLFFVQPLDAAALQPWKDLQLPPYATYELESTSRLPRRGDELTCVMAQYKRRKDGTSGLNCLDIRWVDWSPDSDMRVKDAGDSSSVWSEEPELRKVPLCRFFRTGVCSKQEHCRFTHQPCLRGSECTEPFCIFGHPRGWPLGPERPAGKSGHDVRPSRSRIPSAATTAVAAPLPPPHGECSFVWRRPKHEVTYEEVEYLVYPSDVTALMNLCELDIWHGRSNGVNLLKNYLRHTLMRVIEMNEVFECVMVSDGEGGEPSQAKRVAYIFNTGLYEAGPKADQIFGAAYSSVSTKYQLTFRPRTGHNGAWGRGVLFPGSSIPKLNTYDVPKRANYVRGEDHRLLYFDEDAAVLMMQELDVDHLLGLESDRDSSERWLERARRIRRLEPSWLFEKYIGTPQDEHLNNARLLDRIKKALEVSLSKASGSPRLAVPQYYRPASGVGSNKIRKGHLQLLLPLTLYAEEELTVVLSPSSRDHKQVSAVTCAVVLSLESRCSSKDGELMMAYRVGTLLSGEMALMNARLVQRFNPDWLCELAAAPAAANGGAKADGLGTNRVKRGLTMHFPS